MQSTPPNGRDSASILFFQERGSGLSRFLIRPLVTLCFLIGTAMGFAQTAAPDSGDSGFSIIDERPEAPMRDQLAAHRLHLRIRRHNGSAFAEMRVALAVHADGRRHLMGEGETDADGRVTFDSVPVSAEGSYRLIAQEAPGKPYGDMLTRIEVAGPAREKSLSVQLSPVIGDRAPSLSYLDLSKEQTRSLGKSRGKLVYIDFWATWCGPCQQPMADLNELGRRRGEEWRNQVELIGVSVDRDREKLDAHLQAKNWGAIQQGWVDYSDAAKSRQVRERWGVSAIPTSFLIDPDGEILWRGNPNSGGVEEKIEKALVKLGDFKELNDLSSKTNLEAESNGESVINFAD